MLASLTGEAMKAAARKADQEREQTAPADMLEFREHTLLLSRAHTVAIGGASSGEPCRTRTYNLEIKSLLLYQLS
jgi:hypothetical protein